MKADVRQVYVPEETVAVGDDLLIFILR